MFERYTEDARRVIFFGRYEASNFASPYIEAEHLLLGIVREQPRLMGNLVPALPNYSELHREIAAQRSVRREKISTSVDLPLSNECKRILAYAAEEAERVSDFHVRAQHLLLGIIREDACYAAGVLKTYGADLVSVRQQVLDTTPKRPPGPAGRVMFCRE